MPFLTQTKAIARLRSATRLSHASCEIAVKKMPFIQDGQRRKIHSDTVDAQVAWMEQIQADAAKSPKTHKIKLSKKAKARLHLLAP